MKGKVQTVDINDMKALVGYDPDKQRTAFVSKWADVIRTREDGEQTLQLIDAFTAWRETRGSKKAAASYKSLVTRFVATGELSTGKSGDSMKSAVRAFIWYCDQLTAGVDPETGAVDEPEDLPTDEELESLGEEE